MSAKASTSAISTMKGTLLRRLMLLPLQNSTLLTMDTPAKIVSTAAYQRRSSPAKPLSMPTHTMPATRAAAAGLGRPWK